MPEVVDSGYLSIGEVLGLLLGEFPDITISKIRFLESQGLISPERTSSGYRKFYDDDVELLRVILTEQRENYLPLRVIKDRLQTGEIDPTGEHGRPSDDDSPGASDQHANDADAADHSGEVPTSSIASHPAGRHNNNGSADTAAAGDPADEGASSTSSGDAHADESDEPPPETPTHAGKSPDTRLLTGVLLDRAELCSMVGITDVELSQLESFGIVTSRDGGGAPLYGDDAVEIARPASEFLRLGVDARHLRNWRTSAEREASLYEQLVTPRFRQRNPEARADALDRLRQLDTLGGTLRAAMTRQALRHHFEP